MIVDDRIFKKHKNNKALIIDTLINIITEKDTLISNTSYYYHNDDLQEFLVSLYIFKLVINDIEYIKAQRDKYLEKIKNKLSNESCIASLNLSKITNIESDDEIDLVIKLKELFRNNKYVYDKETKRIVFIEGLYVDAKWLLSFLVVLLDRVGDSNSNKNISVCYTIPDKNIKKCNGVSGLEEFFNSFTYYRIDVKCSEEKKDIKDNSVLVIRNAANNYLKHLKQYKHGLESEEAYLIFYNLLKNECHKRGFVFEEEVKVLNELDENYINKIKDFINDNFYDFSINKQTRTIGNIVWQLSNNINILEHINLYIDSLVFLVELLNRKEKDVSYYKLKWDYMLKDIQILLILVILKFMISYLHDEDIDYSLLDFSNIKPEYMSIIELPEIKRIKEEIVKTRIDIKNKNEELDVYKFERQSISKENLDENKYRNELERCISNINRISIDISNLESNVSNYKKELDSIRFEKKLKYKSVDGYIYNHSIIRHMVNAISNAGVYLKTNNNNELLENIIIIEDYVKTDNAFYLEVSFKDLLRISNQNVINGIEEQSDLPKLR